MNRIEVNVMTGETAIIPMTPKEIAALPPPEPYVEPPPPEPTSQQLKSALSALGLSPTQVSSLFDAAAKLKL